MQTDTATATPTAYARPHLLPRTTDDDIVFFTAGALATGRTVRLGRWIARDDGLGAYEVCAGDDTAACRAGAEPTSWWTEHAYETPEEAAWAFVTAWKNDW